MKTKIGKAHLITPPATPEFNVETVRVIIQQIFLKLTNRWAKKTQH